MVIAGGLSRRYAHSQSFLRPNKRLFISHVLVGILSVACHQQNMIWASPNCGPSSNTAKPPERISHSALVATLWTVSLKNLNGECG